MTDIQSQRIVDRFDVRVRQYANSGISWGSNNYPTGSDTNWFGGSTSGSTDALTSADIGDNPNAKYGAITDIDAIDVVNGMQNHFSIYSQIQRVRILTYRSRSGYSNNASQLIYDGTALANLASLYRDNGDIADGNLTAGQKITWQSAEDFIQRCRDRIYSRRVNTQRTLSNTVCHDSCHSSCHSNRGRR